MAQPNRNKTEREQNRSDGARRGKNPRQGISNAPPEEEASEQEQLPARGDKKKG